MFEAAPPSSGADGETQRLRSRWDISDCPPWQIALVHPLLEKYIDKIKELGINRVLVPACGKSLDMIYFADNGFEVVGVEIADKAVELFFSENQLEFDKEVLGDVGCVRTAKSKQIKIYTCDIRNFSSLIKMPEEGFQLVWDKGFLGAFHKQNRGEMFSAASKVLLPSSHYMWLAFAMKMKDSSKSWPGPPNDVSNENVEDLLRAEKNSSFEVLDDTFDHLVQSTELIPNIKEKIAGAWGLLATAIERLIWMKL